MKLSINISLFLFTLLMLGSESLSLTDYQMKKICRKYKSYSTCLKNLQEKKSSLQKGNLIEIPVIPYKE